MAIPVWGALKSNPQDLHSLSQLSSSRQKLSAISTDQADILLKVLEQLWRAQVSDGQRLTGFTQVFQLLARWAHNSQLIGAAAGQNKTLQTAISGALQLLQSQWLAPSAATACILFLGIASKGCPQQQVEEFALLTCSVLQLLRCHLKDSSQFKEVTAGVAIIVQSLKGRGPLALWLVTSVLVVWAPAPNTNSVSSPETTELTSMGQTVPISGMMHQIGAALVQGRAESAQDVEALTALLASAVQSDHWQEGVTGALAAGALLEELAKAAPAQPNLAPAVQLLAHSLTQACSTASLQSTSSSAESSSTLDNTDVAAVCMGHTLQRDAVAVACCQARQACRLPPPSAGLVCCVMSTLWSSSMSLKGLFQAAAQGQSPEQGTAWLKGLLQSSLFQDAPAMARVAAELYKNADNTAQQACQERVHMGAVELYEGYRHYLATTQPSWVQAVDETAVRQVMDRAFMTAVLLMTTFWQTASSPKHQPQTASHPKSQQQAQTVANTGSISIASNPRAKSSSHIAAKSRTSSSALDSSSALVSSSDSASDSCSSSLVAAQLLDSLSYLQFCRMRLTAYNSLLKPLLTAASTSAQAMHHLMDSMPSYDEAASLQMTARQAGSDGPQTATQQPSWLSDLILASRVQFLMSMLAPCLAILPQDQDSSQLAPVMFLYMQHPNTSVVASSHSLFCATIKQSKKKEELVPFYMRRALEGYPRCTPIAALSAGVDMIARELPSGSPVILLCLQSLAQRATTLLQQNDSTQHSVKTGLDIVRLMAQMQLVVEFQFLTDAMDLTEEVVLACSDARTQSAACDCIREVLIGSDDYTRKATCALRYQHLAARCAIASEQVSRRPAGPVSLLLSGE